MFKIPELIGIPALVGVPIAGVYAFATDFTHASTCHHELSHAPFLMPIFRR